MVSQGNGQGHTNPTEKESPRAPVNARGGGRVQPSRETRSARGRRRQRTTDNESARATRTTALTGQRAPGGQGEEDTGEGGPGWCPKAERHPATKRHGPQGETERAGLPGPWRRFHGHTGHASREVTREKNENVQHTEWNQHRFHTRDRANAHPESQSE